MRVTVIGSGFQFSGTPEQVEKAYNEYLQNKTLKGKIIKIGMMIEKNLKDFSLFFEKITKILGMSIFSGYLLSFVLLFVTMFFDIKLSAEIHIIVPNYFSFLFMIFYSVTIPNWIKDLTPMK